MLIPAFLKIPLMEPHIPKPPVPGVDQAIYKEFAGHGTKIVGRFHTK